MSINPQASYPDFYFTVTKNGILSTEKSPNRVFLSLLLSFVVLLVGGEGGSGDWGGMDDTKRREGKGREGWVSSVFLRHERLAVKKEVKFPSSAVCPDSSDSSNSPFKAANYILKLE